MIIIKLSGGLGNQMFQYAFGKSLSIQNRVELLLDINNFGENRAETPRKYELSIYNINEKFATKKQINKVKALSIIKLIHRKISPSNSSHILEKNYHLNNSNIIIRDIYLDGYWQDEKYFEKYKKVILNKFTINIKPHISIHKWINKIKNCNSVSIHIRRGDYITDKKVQKILKALSINYYIKAIRKIEHMKIEPVFFIFSDDIKWAREEFTRRQNIYFVEHGGEDYENLRIMSLCQHNIIANSSFSWWGAWLNKNPHKIVIGPKEWFCDKKRIKLSIMPKKWLKL